MATETTLRWNDESITTHLADAEAATVCERIPAGHRDHNFVRKLVADLRRYGSLFEGKRFWLHSLALAQLDRESPRAADPGAGSAGSLPRIAAFLTPASRHLKSGARVTFSSGPLKVT